MHLTLHGKCSKISNVFHFLFSNKILIKRTGIQKSHRKQVIENWDKSEKLEQVIEKLRQVVEILGQIFEKLGQVIEKLGHHRKCCKS